MSASFTWLELDSTLEALDQLPEELADEGAAIAVAQGYAAADEMRQAYAPHTKSGNLVDQLEVEETNDGIVARGAVVINHAEYAYWFEHGTAIRHTTKGYNRGAPARPGNVFIPAMQRARFRFELELSALLVRNGLTVT